MTTSETKPGELTYANQVVHESHDASLIEVLKCLTELRFREAITGWRALCEALEAHAKLEEEEVFRAYAALGERPRGAGLELFAADHTSFRKVVNECAGVLAELSALDGESDDLRAEMVVRLKPFLRLRGVLEHHGLREQLHLYPALDLSLEKTERQRLAKRLSASEAAS